MTSILFVTAYSGEPQIGLNMESVSRLKVKKKLVIDQVVIKDLSFLESQRETYMRSRINCNLYDFIFKLDADMVLEDLSVIDKAIAIFEDKPLINHVIIPVMDFFTNREIIGAHVFRSSHVPNLNIQKDIILPQPDYWISNIQPSYVIKSSRNSISHAANPSIHQAFRFGYSRGVKMRAQSSLANHLVNFNIVLKKARAGDLISKYIVCGFLSGLDVINCQNEWFCNFDDQKLKSFLGMRLFKLAKKCNIRISCKNLMLYIYLQLTYKLKKVF